MLTFQECQNIKPGKRLENNTYLEKIDDNTYGVLLHQTIVVEIHRDGTYRLFTGGYMSATTKHRLNKYAPIDIWQHKGQWYYNDRPNGIKKFEEGMLV